MNTEVDVLYLMLLGEISLVLLIIVVVLLRKLSKYKSLYLKTLDNSALTGPDPVVQTPVEEDHMQDIIPEEAQPEKETPAAVEKAVDTTTVLTAEEEWAAAAEEAEGAKTEPEVANGSLTGKVRKLERIAEFQKSKIVDLMGYKDLFESAARRLTAIQESNAELQDKFRTLTESSDAGEESRAALATFESNNKGLNSFINVLSKENETLSEKFSSWQKQLDEMWEQSESGGEVDEGKYSELLKQKEELVSTLKEFEEKLQEKSKALEDMQKQYEDIESEYMILYKQQQQQQPG